MKLVKHILLIAAGLLVSCGGKVTYRDDASAGGSGGESDGSGGSTSSDGGGIVGPATCTEHDECPSGFLCIFSTGQCTPKCGDNLCSGCGEGTICDDCGTSSCSGCFDCRPACVPIQPGECDDSDPCPSGEACLFDQQRCETQCGNAACPSGAECVTCGTGSCCGCKDCVDVCLPFE